MHVVVGLSRRVDPRHDCQLDLAGANLQLTAD